MDDPASKKSPEFLDDTKPERNERGPEPKKKPSLFEEIFGDRKEREEEKLRKKLDAELKEAARKRAEDFEEERRVAEKRDVAETRKLKKRWREQLVEKSQREIDEAAQSDQPPTGYRLAKLMVAEHIIRYQQTLDDKKLDLRKSERKALKTHIDFFGLLSEKLDKPQLEVPEEIQELYTTITSSVEEITGEDLAGSDFPDSTPSPETTPNAAPTHEDTIKEAAKERAEAFEEAHRVAEKRDVAETRKLKKRWREQLVEKSRNTLKNTEKRQESLDTITAAKLVVAERIIKLHDMLENDDLKHSEQKIVKTHIDFMGLLSEKLDRPELKMPDEVEALYQTITGTGTTRQTYDSMEGSDAPSYGSEDTVVPPVSHADASYNQFAGNIVHAIRRAVRPEAAFEQAAKPTRRAERGPRQEMPTEPDAIEERTSQPTISQRLLSLITETALPADEIRQEISQKETARRLADVVEKAEILRLPTFWGRTPERPAKPQASLKIAAPKIALAGIAHTETSTIAVEKPVDIPAPQKNDSPESSLPKKKVKHMTELELLTMAKTITVAGGRLLSDIYTHGEIDREGLIKVLDSYRKGRDYRSEFTFRREKWRRHRESSPEYLTQPQGTPSGPAQPVQFPVQPPPQDSQSTPLAAPAPVPVQSTTPKPPQPTPQPAQASSKGQQPLTGSQSPSFAPKPEQPSAKKQSSDAPVPPLLEKPSKTKSEATMQQKGKTALDKTRTALQKIGPETKEKVKRATREARERLEREGQMKTLFITMTLVIVILLVLIELSFR